MANELTPDQWSKKWVCGLIAVIVCCFVHGSIGLWSVARLVPYLSRAGASFLGLFALFLLEAIIWILLGILLWKRLAFARIATMMWCGGLLIWIGWRYIVASMHQELAHWNLYLVVFGIVTDLAIIAFLSRPEAARLFRK
jgi:hypothetical protein